MKRNDIAGWAGISLILLAFILTTFAVIDAEHIAYGILNLVGALGIIFSSYAKRDFQPVILNIIWLFVAGAGIVRSLM